MCRGRRSPHKSQLSGATGAHVATHPGLEASIIHSLIRVSRPVSSRRSRSRGGELESDGRLPQQSSRNPIKACSRCQWGGSGAPLSHILWVKLTLTQVVYLPAQEGAAALWRALMATQRVEEEDAAPGSSEAAFSSALLASKHAGEEHWCDLSTRVRDDTAAAFITADGS